MLPVSGLFLREGKNYKNFLVNGEEMNFHRSYKLKNRISCNVENLICLFVMSIGAFLFLQKSPLHPWLGANAGTDSSVFKTVALMMERGYMPYRDSFDHKGPLLFIINFLGNKISSYRGIWVFELLFMVITIFILYKIARMSCKIVTSYLSAFLSISLLFIYFDGGNLTEEYAMLFISVSLYIFIDYLKNHRISRLRLAICGLCLGGVLLLRPNMISVWFIFLIAVLIQLLREEKYHKILEFSTWFILGMAVILVPIILWLFFNDSLSWCWKAYIEFNKQYISSENGRITYVEKWNSFFFFFNTTVYLISFSVQAYLCGIKKRKIDFIYMIYLLITSLFLCLSGMKYGHYGMVLIPAVVYPLSQLFAELENIEIKQISDAFIFIVGIYMLSFIILPDWITLIDSSASRYAKKDEDKISDEVRTISTLIKDNSLENEAISVYGNWNIIYIISNRIHATRYSYQFPIGTIMPEIMDEYFDELQEEQPKIIVIAPKRYNERIKEFLDFNQYDLLWNQNESTFDEALVYMKK